MSGLPLVVALLAGCGSSGVAVGAAAKPKPAVPRQAAKPRAPAGPVAPRGCRPGAVQRLGDPRTAYAALVPGHATVFRAPGRRPFATFGPRNVNGAETVLGVLARRVARDCRASWYRVELPIRPNGATGWVAASEVRVGVVHSRIVVDLSERLLTLYRAGRTVLRARAAIGAPTTPTPTGRFYVNQRLIPGDPSGPWGPAAIGVSAHSDVLRNWVQGGPIAIHGTNEPWSIGRAASHGCIRLENRTLQQVFRQAPAGTPVIIRT